MGNAQVHERTCGKFPPPAITRQPKQDVMASPRSVGKAALAKAACKKSTDSDANTASTSATAATSGSSSTPAVAAAGATQEPTESSSTSGGSRRPSVFRTIKNTLRDIFDPPEPERLPPKRFPPKHMLYGCTTTEEHYDYIEEMCNKVADLHGKEGLQAMGFDFQIVHHSKTCQCPGVIQPPNDDDLTDSEADEDELKEGYMEESEDDDEYGQFDNSSSDDERDEEEGLNETFMVPLKEEEDAPKSDLSASNVAFHEKTSFNGGGAASPYGFSAASRNTSVVSLFSLATHNTDTDFSNPTTGSAYGMDDTNSRQRRQQQQRPGNQRKSARFPLATISSQPAVAVMEQDSCALRLHHMPSGGTMITAENHLRFIPDGKFYDELARLCMEYSQQVMMEEGDLEWTTICPERKFGAMASRSYMERLRQRQSNATQQQQQQDKHKTLVVVTGKGEVQAGIFSRRHLLVTSMEAATALPFIRGARERGMDVIMLDPNALGYRMGMDVVETSLEYFFMGGASSKTETETEPPPAQQMTNEEDIYVLAHSMAGAQIVRFFTSNSCTYSRPPTPASSASESTTDGGGTASSSNADDSATKEAEKAALLKQIRALAFTDSNHNINWTKNHPFLTKVLTGRPSLYIKSHKVHEKAKSLGEKHHDCQFWKHRFGNIKTLWAGTHEHALTNYTARAHIWEHFDSFLELEQ